MQSLVQLFYDDPHHLGLSTQIAGHEVPQPYRQLLDHNEHMTVTVEAHHESKVDVQVLSVQRDSTTYCRKILLSRQTDQKVVQFGIVRLHLKCLESKAREEIESESIPLGRVLIQNNVLRIVELCQLYRFECGADLAQQFGARLSTLTYGRTALIYCNGEPGVELLEIVSPY